MKNLKDELTVFKEAAGGNTTSDMRVDGKTN
jgi:hypothetical protein